MTLRAAAHEGFLTLLLMQTGSAMWELAEKKFYATAPVERHVQYLKLLERVIRALDRLGGLYRG